VFCLLRTNPRRGPGTVAAAGKQGQVSHYCVTRLSDALASLEVETPSLVLLTRTFSDSRGAETIRRIKQKAPNVPIVVYSSQDDEETRDQSRAARSPGLHCERNVHCVGCGHLDRSIQYAMERQALVLAAEANRKQQLEFKDAFFRTFRMNCARR